MIARWRFFGALVLVGGASSAFAGEPNAAVQTLTRFVTVEVDELVDVPVVGAAEMRDALSLEAKKQAIGCADDSCIAEIAAAVGTSHILQMQLGAVGQTFLLSIQLFDDNARVLSRQSVRGKTIDELTGKLRPTLSRLLNEAGLTRPEEGSRLETRSLLILDLVATDLSPPEREAPKTSPNTLLMGGMGVLVVGALAAVGAGVTGAIFALRNADLEGATQHEVLGWQAATYGTAGVAAIVLMSGAALSGLGWLTGGENVE